jgi:hypothetical protein
MIFMKQSSEKPQEIGADSLEVLRGFGVGKHLFEVSPLLWREIFTKNEIYLETSNHHLQILNSP